MDSAGYSAVISMAWLVMISDNTVLAELRTQFPATVVKVDPYFGSFIRLDLVNRYGSSMSVHLYLCHWEFLENSVSLATSNSDSETWRSTLGSLVQSELIDLIQRSESSLALVFRAERSIVVSADLFEYECEDDLMWMTLSDHIVAYSPKGGFVKEVNTRAVH